MRCVSDTLKENLRLEETASAPIGGASPPVIEDVSEIEVELPTVTDCTSLTLVDAIQGESASLGRENLFCSVESKDCHEGTYSVAFVAENEFSLTSAIADTIEPSLSASLRDAVRTLMPEDSVSGMEVKADHEDTCSAAPEPNPDKWSRRAIVARSNLRPERIQKLKVAGTSGQNPGFNFLLECWGDPVLAIAIKKLLPRYPQWRIACVDGELLEWEG